MERKEFEQVLKRALELQSIKQSTTEKESFNLEDLNSAATRLGINAEILEQALKETQKQHHKFILSAPPEQVREKFIKHFLMNESTANQHAPGLRIDHEFIRNNPSGPVRVINPIIKETDAFVEFSTAANGGTIVSWQTNIRLPWPKWLLIVLWPLFILIPMAIGPLMNGILPAELIPVAAALVFTSVMMHLVSKNTLGRVETTLESYFQNYQTLDEIESKKSIMSEQKMPDPTITTPIPELNDSEIDPNNDSAENRPKNRLTD